MRFLVFVFAFLFIAAIFFVRDEILSKRAKIIATALIVLLCAGAYFYESASERSAKLEEEMVFKFNAGARLRCGGAINFASETRGSINSSPEKHGANAKNLGLASRRGKFKRARRGRFHRAKLRRANERAGFRRTNKRRRLGWEKFYTKPYFTKLYAAERYAEPHSAKFREPRRYAKLCLTKFRATRRRANL